MSERGQGIRLFSCEEELSAIFEEWDPEEDEEDEDEEEDEEATPSAESSPSRSPAMLAQREEKERKKEEGKDIITSQLRHFIVQPYIHPPLLLYPPSTGPDAGSGDATQALRKFHIRTYVLAVDALKIYVYKPMLALFAARPYVPPWGADLQDDMEEAMKGHLTNTCLQESNEREGSVGLFWELPHTIPPQTSSDSIEQTARVSADEKWKDTIFKQICAVTGEVFEAAARSMSIHFQPLPNAFELFGLDFMVSVERDGELRAWLLEVNAFPDFRQTGDELKDLVGRLFEGVVDKAVAPFFGLDGGKEGGEGELVQVLDIDLGRR
ncbi:tubulin-tyrosine ligase [Trematosphaeria pertusa]|uniref:Tubulin-tyrosine ligase n=1 Tax=Trematosphaeria pertusa TaxID=390896 RepID=A0A6A6I286_9PLEO|nr:tubulin-tyrosine ligase [Trematosphaeria pertusa]KAF2244451.1 tubulin-tyrosine ligase [Trematosphaeria pertusa]